MDKEEFSKSKTIIFLWFNLSVHFQQSWETSLRSAGVPFHKHFIQYRKNRQRELVQQIADKNRVSASKRSRA